MSGVADSVRALRSRPPSSLAEARVLVVGLGGLGSPVTLHLAAAGVGTLGLCDGDAVDLSNLQRQILYRTADVGVRKVEAAAARLHRLFPALTLHVFDERLHGGNADRLLAGFDLVVDATDGITSKYLVNDAAVLHGRPFVHAGVLGFHGQLMTVQPRESACLRCLFPVPPAEGDVPTCREAGVVGALVGIVGALQATEAVRVLLGLPGRLTDRMLTYDALGNRWRSVTVRRAVDCPVCGEEPTIRRLEAVAPESAVCSVN